MEIQTKVSWILYPLYLTGCLIDQCVDHSQTMPRCWIAAHSLHKYYGFGEDCGWMFYGGTSWMFYGVKEAKEVIIQWKELSNEAILHANFCCCSSPLNLYVHVRIECLCFNETACLFQDGEALSRPVNAILLFFWGGGYMANYFNTFSKANNPRSFEPLPGQAVIAHCCGPKSPFRQENPIETNCVFEIRCATLQSTGEEIPAHAALRQRMGIIILLFAALPLRGLRPARNQKTFYWFAELLLQAPSQPWWCRDQPHGVSLVLLSVLRMSPWALPNSHGWKHQNCLALAVISFCCYFGHRCVQIWRNNQCRSDSQTTEFSWQPSHSDPCIFSIKDFAAGSSDTYPSVSFADCFLASW